MYLAHDRTHEVDLVEVPSTNFVQARPPTIRRSTLGRGIPPSIPTSGRPAGQPLPVPDLHRQTKCCGRTARTDVGGDTSGPVDVAATQHLLTKAFPIA
jgi:hypothetical protein